MSKPHFGALAKSTQQQRLLAFLRSRSGSATTMEITVNCQITAVSQVMQALEASGYPYSCRREGVSASGALVYRYTLLPLKIAAREEDRFLITAEDFNCVT